MNTVCQKDKCTGCGACMESCGKNAITIQDSIHAYNAVIEERKCINCNVCHNVCPQNHTLDFKEPILWKQGWVNDPVEREKSSSGGFGTAIIKGFINNGGVVWSCEFRDGKFGFSRAETVSESEKFRGSKYVKSSPHGIYKEIKKTLADGKKVLFLGLPCQSAGVQKFVGAKLSNNLYTVDLICHGTPSPELLKDFFRQDYGIRLTDLKDIKFRNKVNFGIHNEYIPLVKRGTRDRYLLAFLDSIDYTDNCYDCKYARKQRISDLTIGDSWGSELLDEEEKGISLVLCQNEKGKELLEKAEIYLTDVDIDRAIEFNKQLQRPSSRTKKLKQFRKLYVQKGFHKAINQIYWKYYLKQLIKKFLLRLGIRKIRGGVMNSYQIFIQLSRPAKSENSVFRFHEVSGTRNRE